MELENYFDFVQEDVIRIIRIKRYPKNCLRRKKESTKPVDDL